MSSTIEKLKEGFTSEDHDYLRVFQCVKTQGKTILYCILQWGIPPSASKDLRKYLLEDLKASGKVNSKTFNRTMVEKINADPIGENFDISTLYIVIKVGCNNMAPSADKIWFTPDLTMSQLEYLITLVKDKRNHILHHEGVISKQEMMDELEELRSLLTKTIEAAGLRYSKNPAEVEKIVDVMNDNINTIRDEPLADTDIKKYQKELLHEHLKKLLIEKGPKELQATYRKLSRINPVHFLDDSDYYLEVGLVFSKLEIEEAGKYSFGKEVDHEDLLQVCSESVSDVDDEVERSSLILLEGVAGSGKTTLIKFTLSDWSESLGSIKNLADYDILLLMMCRDSHIDSISGLFKSLMPETLKSFRDVDNLLHCALDTKVLVLVDGLDELNPQSEKVFKNLLSLSSKTRNLTIMCTSRPEKVRYLYKKAPAELRKVRLRIKGVPVTMRGHFVQKYHDELKKRNRSDQSTADLVKYINRSSSQLQEHFRSPLNLVLLTHLWAEEPKNVTVITTASELYIQVNKLLIEKLVERLIGNSDAMDGATSISPTELAKKCQRFEKGLFAEALISHSERAVNLSKSSKERMIQMCQTLQLSQGEVLYHFLVMKVISTSGDGHEIVSFPHEDMHDFYSASCIYLAISDDSYYRFLVNLIGESNSYRFNLFKIPRYIVQGISNAFGFSSTSQQKPREVPQWTDNSSVIPVEAINTISHVLELLYKHKTESLKVSRYQNILKHLAGLFGYYELHNESITKELVTLLSRSGITDKDQWLDVLREVKCDASTARHISRFVAHNMKGVAFIDDAKVGTYASLMPHSNPSAVIVELTDNACKIPRLRELFVALSSCSCSVELKFHRDFQEMEKCDDDLHCFTREDPPPSCSVNYFLGHVSKLTVLPRTVKTLYVPIVDGDHAIHFIDSMKGYASILPDLQKLGLHMKPTMAADRLDTLPALSSSPDLYLSEVGEDSKDWVCDIAQTLQPENGFFRVYFPKSSLSLHDVKDLITSLKHRAIKIHKFIAVSSSGLTTEDEAELSQLCKEEFDCSFIIFNEESIWLKS